MKITKLIKKVIGGKKDSRVKKEKVGEKKSSKKKNKEKPVGKVTHYFGKIKVAVVKCSANIRVGMDVEYRGATTTFSDTIRSMQKDHVSVRTAKKGASVGVKVKKKVRVGDRVYPAA
jgi:uncharacterized glyoxalase superfamily protein PhnB